MSAYKRIMIIHFDNFAGILCNRVIRLNNLQNLLKGLYFESYKFKISKNCEKNIEILYYSFKIIFYSIFLIKRYCAKYVQLIFQRILIVHFHLFTRSYIISVNTALLWWCGKIQFSPEIKRACEVSDYIISSQNTLKLFPSKLIKISVAVQ